MTEKLERVRKAMIDPGAFFDLKPETRPEFVRECERRDAAIRARAIEECAAELDRYYDEEYEKRGRLCDIGNGPYRKIESAYDEGFTDAVGMAEQRLRALLATDGAARADGGEERDAE